MTSCTSSNYPSASSCNDGCTSRCLSSCTSSQYNLTSSCDGWCLSNCTSGCLATCGYGCGDSACSDVCTNACRCSCGNGCGPATSNCGGNCTANSKSPLGCNSYCLHDSCGFSCGGDAEIKTNLGCGTSSCSATGCE